jgi:hypothetical protein
LRPSALGGLSPLSVFLTYSNSSSSSSICGTDSNSLANERLQSECSTIGISNQNDIQSENHVPTFRLTLIATVQPPEVTGTRLQATQSEVDSSGKNAFVSYSVAGETQKGAIDTLDLKDPFHPKLIQSLSLPTSGVNSIAVS